MKKLIVKLLILAVTITAIIFALNIKVTTLQGVDYKVHTIKIPLYLKILDFMDRHYNHKQIVNRIIKNENDRQKRVMKIFSWTYHNIRKQPDELPVVDDHVWHIIVRGYGVSDQSSDVFTTLCNYAGAEAFFNSLGEEENREKITLSFVRLDNRWYVFDPFNGVYFVNKGGALADIDAIKKGNYRLEYLGPPKKAVSDYSIYLENMPDIKEIGLRRETVQSPLKRFLYMFK
jgi:hypothetical protein